MPANELVRLLLDDLRPDGRPDAALGTSGHTVDNLHQDASQSACQV